jgi:hypothetical protein
MTSFQEFITTFFLLKLYKNLELQDGVVYNVIT